MGGYVSSAGDFFKKYGLDQSFRKRIDQDLRQDGVQNDEINIDELVDDYYRLSPAERYAVFVRLQRGGDYEVLKLVSGFEERTRPFRAVAVTFETAFDEVISGMRARVKDKKDIWERRLEIAGGIFAIEILLDADGIGTHDLLKEHIRQGLILLYKELGPSIFDTDGDFNPYAKRSAWEYAFDHQDVLPLDSSFNVDRDGDGVADELDLKPDIPSSWMRLKIGEEVHTRNYTIRRTSEDKFEISSTIRVAADPAGNLDNINKTLMSRDALAERKKWIEEAFSRAVEKGRYRFSLNITFVVDDANFDVRFSDRDIRSTMRLWGGSLLFSGDAMLHEVFHLFGMPDYYSEPNVHEGIRDFTTKPGYGVLAKDHLMACALEPVIPQKMLLNMVAKAAASPEYRPPSPTGGDKTTAVMASQPAKNEKKQSIANILRDILPPDSAYYFYFFSGRIDGEEPTESELSKQLTEIEGKIAVESDLQRRDALLCKKAVNLLLQGKKREGIALLMDVFERNIDDDDIASNIYNILIEGGNVEDAIIVAKKKWDNSGESMWLYLYVKALHKAGRCEEVAAMEELFQRNLASLNFSLLTIWIDCLIETGNYKKLDAYVDYVAAQKNRHSQRDTVVVAGVIAARLIKSGDLARAKEIFLKYAESILDHNGFIYSMRANGFVKESVEWFNKYIFPHLDCKNDSDIITLRSEAEWRAKNGFIGETLQIYNLLLRKDPHNIDYHLGYAMALFAHKRSKEAVMALVGAGNSYAYMESRDLIKYMTWDDFVNNAFKQIKQNGYQDAFLREGIKAVKCAHVIFNFNIGDRRTPNSGAAFLRELLERFGAPNSSLPPPGDNLPDPSMP